MSYQGAAKGPRRKGLLALGIVVLIGGVGTGLGLAGASQSTYADAVANLARVPAGCDTEIDADETATFVVYVETEGEIGELRGDCDNVDTDYERDDEPDVEVTILDDGDEVRIARYDGASYDVDGFVGTAIGEVELEEGTTYIVQVESDDTDFAIALGHDPKGDAESAATIGVIVAAAGLLLGVVLIILGLRRRPPAVAVGASAFTPAAAGSSPFGNPTTGLGAPQPPGLGAQPTSGAYGSPPPPDGGGWAPPPPTHP